MNELVDNLKAVFRDHLERVPWMTDATRAKALAKFDRFTQKIGYPDKFRDYSSVMNPPAMIIWATCAAPPRLSRIGKWPAWAKAGGPDRVAHDAANGQRLFQSRCRTKLFFRPASCSRRSLT